MLNCCLRLPGDDPFLGAPSGGNRGRPLASRAIARVSKGRDSPAARGTLEEGYGGCPQESLRLIRLDRDARVAAVPGAPIRFKTQSKRAPVGGVALSALPRRRGSPGLPDSRGTPWIARRERVVPESTGPPMFPKPLCQSHVVRADPEAPHLLVRRLRLLVDPPEPNKRLKCISLSCGKSLT